MQQDLPFSPHPEDSHGGQAHGVPRLQMRLVRNRRQVKKQLTLTHVQTAQGDINKGEQALNENTKALRVFVYLKMGYFKCTFATSFSFKVKEI